MNKKLISMAFAALLLASCAQQNGAPANPTMGGSGINKSDIGTIVGAIGGGVIGHNIGKGSGRTVATIAGTLLGAGLGNSLGSSLDRADISYYDQASQSALETARPGQTLPWQNPQSGNSGTITPSNYYQTASGQYCREYTQTIKVGGQSKQGYGQACRQPDGTWQIVQ